MKWEELQKGYRVWLMLEKGLSKLTIKAYITNIQSFILYACNSGISNPQKISRKDLEEYLANLNELSLSVATQSRIISALRSFFNYLLIENEVESNPAMLLDLPARGVNLPDVLSVEEVFEIIAAIDLSKPNGERDKAILETLYGCGLRVSELINLKISDIFFREEFLRITGKGDKERLVPMGKNAGNQLQRYITHVRNNTKVYPGFEDYVFLNRLGKMISRVTVFNMVKHYTALSGIRKNVSPHSFRHSFASHLIEGGADLRAVQQMLGHASITTTEIYTHVSNRYLRDAILRFHPLESGKI